MSQVNDTTKNTARTFKHLTYEERCRIEALLKLEYGPTAIGLEIGRPKSTISTEIKRGTATQIGSNGKKFTRYFADTGQAVYERNRRNSKAKPFEERYSQVFFDELKAELKKQLRKFSVETFIVDYQKRNPLEKIPCFKTVYNLIDKGLTGILNIDLPRKVGLRKRSDAPSSPKGTNAKKLGKSIVERPEEVLSRATFGHWEADLVKGKKEQGEPALITLVERQSRYALIKKIESFDADTCKKGLEALISEAGVSLFKTITFDNGAEFSLASELENLTTGEHQLQVFFAHAYSSWERGTNENFNGLLREFVKKGTSLHDYSEEELLAFEECLNSRPRKILGFKTAEEVFDMAA